MKSICVGLLLLLSCSAYAQRTTFSIKGTILDSLTNKGIEFATVVIKNPLTDQVITGETADSNGEFTLENIKAGKYQLVITFIGYDPKSVPIKVSADMKIPPINLSSNSATLNAAVIVAEKSYMTKTAEKTTFNVAQSPTSQIGTAEDVLRNIPGISVDQNGNITITGKSGVKVLVNGRPDALAQSDLQSFLKSLPANSIETIEVINSPSAQYDAEGNAGIINIILKKGKADGLNGSISAGYGILNRYNGNAVANYRKGKVNVFGTYSINDTKTDNRWIENRTVTTNDTTSHYNLHNNGSEVRLNNSLKAGFDYSADDKTTFTYTAGGNYSKGKNTSNGASEYLDSIGNQLNSYTSANNQTNYNFSVSNDFSFRKKLDSAEQEISIDLNHTYLQNAQNVNLTSLAYDTGAIYDAANSQFRRTTSTNYIHDINFQADYSRAIKKLKGSKIEAGFKSSTTVSKNIFNAYNTANNTQTFDSLLSNRFNYTQNISALYVLLRGNYKNRFTYSGGLRGTYTYIKSNDNHVYQSYPDLFPSAAAGYSINDTQNVSITYSRRVQRPQFRQINNTVTYIDQYTTWQGNPTLKPSYSNNIGVNYTIHVAQHMFSFDASGNFQDANFIQTVSVDSSRISHQTVSNGGMNKIFNLSFYCKLHITRWWDFQMNNNYAYKNYGYEPGVNLSSIQGSAYNFWSSTDFKFWKDMVLNVNGWVNTKSVNQQGNSLAVGSLNASVKKPFLKNDLIVSIAANNILNTMKWGWINTTPGLVTQGSWQSFNRYVTITLTYKFGIHDNRNERKGQDENDQLRG